MDSIKAIYHRYVKLCKYVVQLEAYADELEKERDYYADACQWGGDTPSTVRPQLED